MQSKGLLSETLDGGPAVTSLSPEQTEASWTSSSNQRREGSPQIHSRGKYSLIMAFSHYNVKQGARELHHPNKRAPRGHSGKESACQCGRHKRHRFDPWVGKIPWRRKRQPTPVFLCGKSRGQRSLVVYSPWGCKRIGLSD